MPVPRRPSSHFRLPRLLHCGQRPEQKVPYMPGAHTHSPSTHAEGGSQVAGLQNQGQSGTQFTAPIGGSLSTLKVRLESLFQRLRRCRLIW